MSFLIGDVVCSSALGALGMALAMSRGNRSSHCFA